MRRGTLGWLISLLLAPTASAGSVTVQRGSNGVLQIEVRQAPPRQALAALAKQERLLIHDAGLTDAKISASCVEDNLQRLVSCLLNEPVDMVLRSEQERPAELWLLVAAPSVAQPAADNAEPERLDVPASHAANPVALTAEQLQEEATGSDPEQRAQGIMLLAANQQLDADTVHELLTAALSDDNAQVRAQAVQGLARREGKGATAMLQAALLDKDQDVKLAAIDSAGDNEQLLRQAMADSDQSISRYAAAKLAELATQ